MANLLQVTVKYFARIIVSSFHLSLTETAKQTGHWTIQRAYEQDCYIVQ